MSRFFRFTPEEVLYKPDFNQGSLKKFQSKSAEKFSITIRLRNKNQSPIDPDRFFDRDRDRAYHFSIEVWLKWKNQTAIFNERLPKDRIQQIGSLRIDPDDVNGDLH